MMIFVLASRIVITVFGVLYPAYKSYKALKYKNVKELVRLTMYWIVFSMFLAVETVTDVFLTWFPLYYELKIGFVLYLVLPFTQGSSIIYRKIIHPQLSKKEFEIDEAIERAAETGCTAVMQFGAKGLTYAASTVINTAIKGQDLIVNHLNQRSLSMDDLWRQKDAGYPQRADGDTATLATADDSRRRAGDQGSRHRRVVQKSKPESSNLYNLTEQEEEDRSISTISADTSSSQKRVQHNQRSLRARKSKKILYYKQLSHS